MLADSIDTGQEQLPEHLISAGGLALVRLLCFRAVPAAAAWLLAAGFLGVLRICPLADRLPPATVVVGANLA